MSAKFKNGTRIIPYPPEFSRELCPEGRLLIAILDRAIRDVFSKDPTIAREDRRSASWYFESQNEDQYGSFKHLCKWIGIDYRLARERIFKNKIRLSGVRRSRSIAPLGDDG